MLEIHSMWRIFSRICGTLTYTHTRAHTLPLRAYAIHHIRDGDVTFKLRHCQNHPYASIRTYLRATVNVWTQFRCFAFYSRLTVCIVYVFRPKESLQIRTRVYNIAYDLQYIRNSYIVRATSRVCVRVFFCDSRSWTDVVKTRDICNRIYSRITSFGRGLSLRSWRSRVF